MALMILADRWARQRGGTAWALIVDHGLRPESAAEAEKVRGWLTRRGIPHTVLVWEGPKPITGIQEAARTARYRLMTDWCTERGCLHLLTAHQRDDQIETFLIRRRAKSGAIGLAGISAVREMRGIRLVRPLLNVSKARLVAFLDAEEQPYVEDPSNRNSAFERARLRITGEVHGAQGVMDEIRGNAAARIARENELAALLARAVALHPAGFAVIVPDPIAASGALGERALGRIAAVIGAAVYPLRRERLGRLREALGAPTRARTLGGCRFVPWRGRVVVLREVGRVAPPISLTPGMSVMWDQRFVARMPAAAQASVRVGALGIDGVAALRHSGIADDNPLPRFIYPTLPAVWDEAGLLAVPHLLWRKATGAILPHLTFRPVASLFSIGFTVV